MLFGRGFFDRGGAFGQRVKIDRRDRTAARSAGLGDDETVLDDGGLNL